VRIKSKNATRLSGAALWLIFGALAVIPVCCSVVAQDFVNAPIAEANLDTRGEVHIGVLGLFHPQQLTVSAASGSALVLYAGDESVTLEKSSGIDSATVRISGNHVEVSAGERAMTASSITVASRKNEPVDFILAVPGKITRHYRGTLQIEPSSGVLLAVVTMDIETAVASVVAAESAPETPPEALKAQAVAARSYLTASRGRHHEFDFCDTTHCQFLREPPAAGSAVAAAVAATRNLVLAYDSHPFAAMYTRSCSGRTRTPVELGISPAAYPYFSVECAHCRNHPVRWSTRISARDVASLHPSDESARLNIDRRLGWSAVQSNDFVVTTTGNQSIVAGTGQGHGIGLCQSGARAMAEEGVDFRQILSHYYPNTDIVSAPTAVFSRTDAGQFAKLHCY
jgi:stage II sporulation protein D